MILPLEAREIVVPECVIWPPGIRVWDATMKADAEFAVMVEKSRVMAGVPFEGVRVVGWATGAIVVGLLLRFVDGDAGSLSGLGFTGSDAGSLFDEAAGSAGSAGESPITFVVDVGGTGSLLGCGTGGAELLLGVGTGLSTGNVDGSGLLFSGLGEVWTGSGVGSWTGAAG